MGEGIPAAPDTGFCLDILRGTGRLVMAGILSLSGVTDLADGYIARCFHMVSDWG